MRWFVLRRPPLGHVLASAHDVGREFRIISGLQDSAVPVPPALGLCEDRAVNGAPFYVMGYVDGLWGPSFDPGDTSANMARFIEAEFADPAFMKCTWSRHVQDWLGTERPSVHAVGYEQLKADPVKAVAQLMSSIEGRPADQRRVELTVARNDFELTSGRQAGTEDTTNELRKGIVGDWRNVFTREAAEVLESCAGAQLRLLGYEQDASWVESVAH